MVDLSTWIQNTGVAIVAELPLQSLDNAASQAYIYLSNVGGWVPDNLGHPTGAGHAANGFTEQQAADAITAAAYAAVYDIDFHVTIVVRVQGMAKLTSGLTLNTAAASMASQLSAFVTNQITDSPIPVRVLSTSTQTTDTGQSSLGGTINQTIRQAIAADIVSGNKVVDYKALTLMYLTNTYGLDDTWNVLSVYKETNTPINVIIRKYTDTTYATLDSGDTRAYVMNVSPESYEVVTGSIIG